MEFQLASHAKSNMKVPQNSFGVSAPVVDKIREAMRTKIYAILQHKFPARIDAATREKFLHLATILDRILVRSAKSLEEYAELLDLEDRVGQIMRRFSSRRRVASTPSSVGMNGGGHSTITFTKAVYTYHADIRKRMGLKEQMTPLAESEDKLSISPRLE